jgi:hypothetical protein
MHLFSNGRLESKAGIAHARFLSISVSKVVTTTAPAFKRETTPKNPRHNKLDQQQPAHAKGIYRAFSA